MTPIRWIYLINKVNAGKLVRAVVHAVWFSKWLLSKKDNFSLLLKF